MLCGPVWCWLPLSVLCSWDPSASSHGRNKAAPSLNITCTKCGLSMYQQDRALSQAWSFQSPLRLHIPHPMPPSTGLNSQLWGRESSPSPLEPTRFSVPYRDLWYSEILLLNPRSRSINISWETRPPGDRCALSNMRSTALPGHFLSKLELVQEKVWHCFKSDL